MVESIANFITANQVIIAVSIFILTYLAIMLENFLKIHRTVFALSGAVLLIMLHVVSQDPSWHEIDHIICESGQETTQLNQTDIYKDVCVEKNYVEEIKGAIGFIDWNTIGLLCFMMIVVAIIGRTGLFELIALYAVKIARGNPFVLMTLFSLVVAVVSAFFDNVTTIILMAPILLAICKDLKLDFVPFFISAAIASNIGGTATLIGDPPNIIIGSLVKLSFIDFLTNLTLPVLITLVFAILAFRFIYRNKLKINEDIKDRVKNISTVGIVKNKKKLVVFLFVLALTLTGFMLHNIIHLEVATIAAFGALGLMFASRIHPEEIFKEVEWPALFFFIGLFVIIGCLEKLGVLKMIAVEMMKFTHGDMKMTMFVILWFSAFASAVIDNIPFTATMIPLIKEMAAIKYPALSGVELWHSPEILGLWWALALGACLGGNGSLIGASANVVIAGISERHGRPITFMSFTKIGFPIMVGTILIIHIYMLLFDI